MRFPPAFWAYARLRDRGGKPPWPPPIPNPVPASWKIRYALHRGVKPKPVYSGVFTGNGVLLRSNGGESEDVSAMTAARFSWVAPNVGDGVVAGWDLIRQRCGRHGRTVVPWLRAWNPGMTAEQADERIRELVGWANAWSSPALIVNLEDEAWNGVMPPERAARILREQGWAGEVGCSTVGYPPAWPKWQTLNAVGLMQAFMNERADLLPAVCAARGVECGFKAAYPTYGTYPAKVPWTAAGYRALWNGPMSVYPGDEVGAAHQWGEWS